MWKNVKSWMVLNSMNNNAIISVSMLCALWKTNHQDLLSLLEPFVTYAVGTKTKVEEAINIENVCVFMESEFGYKTFSRGVTTKILNRMASSKRGDKQKIIKKNNQFYLVESLGSQIDEFESKRTLCKGHSDSVSKALAEYLNFNACKKRKNYNQDEASHLLLNFFERQGSSILVSVDEFIKLSIKDNEFDYFIGLFILEQNNKKTVLMDYLLELAKGYFITTALYLQADNLDVTKSSFKNVTFYIDTGLLLAYLGYKTREKNESVQETIKSLKNCGAKIACFSYNAEEINSILTAYKMSRVNSQGRPSIYTLEKFDELRYGYDEVDREQLLFRERLEGNGIRIVDPNLALEEGGVDSSIDGILDDSLLKREVVGINAKYKEATLTDDVTAINTISRLRNGREIRNVERCKAVFVTPNTVLAAATTRYCKANSINVGFPLVITDEELCVIAWLKNFEKENNLPQMRLLENVLAAITPSKELMDNYLSQIEYTKTQQNGISDAELYLLRVDHFAQQEMMRLTHGNPENLNSNIIDQIRDTMKAESRLEGRRDGYLEGRKDEQDEYKRQEDGRKKRAYQNIEQKVRKRIDKKKSICIFFAKYGLILLSLSFLVATIYLFVDNVQNTKEKKDWICSFFVFVVTTPQAIKPLLGKNNILTNLIERKFERKYHKELDRQKRDILNILEPTH